MSGRGPPGSPSSSHPDAPQPPSAAPLFDTQALEAARAQGAESHYRWLALSDDPEAVALRDALQRCFRLADRKGELLRKGLVHERWGQHIGALAHLLTLGLLAAQGWRVTAEPGFGRQSPDILAMREAGGADGAGQRLLVEVRSITGAGSFPWERRRESGRTLAHDPEKERLVRDTVSKVLSRKAEVYRQLVARLRIPYVIAIYEDKDSEIARLVREVAFGRAGDDDARDPGGGVFGGSQPPLDHVAAALVFGRLDTEDGRLLLRGELIENPRASFPLPRDAFPRLRAYRLDAARSPPRVRFAAPAPAPSTV